MIVNVVAGVRLKLQMSRSGLLVLLMLNWLFLINKEVEITWKD